MTIDIALQTGPLELPETATAGAGAIVRFEGRVRAEEKGATIDALEYEAYEPMALAQMEKIARELGALHACLGVRVRHRLGACRSARRRSWSKSTRAIAVRRWPSSPRS